MTRVELEGSMTNGLVRHTVRFGLIVALWALGSDLLRPSPSTLSLSAQTSDADTRFRSWMTQAQSFARRGGFTAGFPDFACETVVDGQWQRRRCGLVVLNAVVAEERWLPDAALGITGSPSSGDVFTLASDYAARIGGYVGAFPTMI